MVMVVLNGYIDVVRSVIKDVSHASAMSVIPMSCRRLITMKWLIVSLIINQVTQVLVHGCCQGLTVDHWKFW